jgi:hypothetical protein
MVVDMLADQVHPARRRDGRDFPNATEGVEE